MKSVKLFSGLLAASMLLGTMTTATPALNGQSGNDNVRTARAATEKEDKLTEVTLNEDVADVQNGKLTWKYDEEAEEAVTDFIEQLNGTHLIIPERLNNKVVRQIGYGMFSGLAEPGEGIKQVTLPETVKTINEGAFSDSQIERINLENVESIVDGAFAGNKLTSISLDSIEEIGGGSFVSNELTSIYLSENLNLKNVSLGAFNGQSSSVSIVEDDSKLDNPKIIEVVHADPMSWSSILDSSNISIKHGSTELLTTETLSFRDNLDSDDGVVSDEVKQEFTNVPSLESGNVFYRYLTQNEDDSIGGYGITVGIKSVEAKEEPGPGGNGETEKPNPTPTPENNNNNETDTEDNTDNSKPTTKYPHRVYAKRAMRLHKTVELDHPLQTYKKQVRTKAKSFDVLGVAYSKNGAKRYRVKGGYITANSEYVTNQYYQSNTKKLQVIGKAINSYTGTKFTRNQRVRHYKKGAKLNVRRIVKHGKITRYQLTNGRYVTANKQLVKWTN